MRGDHKWNHSKHTSVAGVETNQMSFFLKKNVLGQYNISLSKQPGVTLNTPDAENFNKKKQNT